MARQLRIHPPGGFHHVTARGNNKLPIFTDDEDRHGFLRVLAEACKRTQCDLIAYCLMTNHVHLVVRDREGKLSDCLRHVKGVYAQRFNQRHGRTGHLFEGRFWNSLLETDSYLAVAVEYVHRNPIEAGLVGRSVEYPWSSYQEYLGLRPPLDVLSPVPVLALYGNDRALLRTATECPARDEVREAELAKRRPSPVLGSEDFTTQMALSAPPNVETAASRRRAESGPRRSPIGKIVTAVAQVHGVPVLEVTTKLRGHVREARACAIFLAHREGWPLACIAEHFDLGSASSVSMTRRRFEVTLESVADAKARLADVERRLAVNC